MSACRDKRFEDLLGAYEVGMLDDDDRRALELHALDCESCRQNLLQFDDAARLLKNDPDVRRAIQEVSTASPEPTGFSRLFSRMKTRPVLVPALLAAAAVFVLLVLQPWHIEFHPNEAVAVENRLAVMYFDNLADPGDQQRLGEIAANLLITDLSSSSYFQVVSGQRLYDILKLLGREGQKHIDRQIAREVADTARADLMLMGSILQTEPYFLLTAQLLEVSTGDVIASQRIEGEPGQDIFALVDRLTVQIKNGLSLPDGAVHERDRRVAEVTTSSPEAYRYYLEGLEYLNKYYLTDAVDCFAKAVELDSTFAMAYYYLSELTDRNLVEKAMTHLDHTGPREKYYIRSLNASVQGKLLEAIAELKELIARFPDEKEAMYQLGVYSTTVSKYKEAVDWFERALAIDPADRKVHNHLAYLYDQMGEYEKAISAIDAYIALAPGEANPFDSRGEICARNGRVDQAIESFQQALRIKPDFFNSLFNLGNMYLLRQEYARADSFYTRLAMHTDPGTRSLGRLYRSFIPLVQGKFSEALRMLDDGLAADEAEGHIEVTSAFKHFIKSRIYVELGQCEKAIEEFTLDKEIFRQVNPKSEIYDRNIEVQMLVECGKLDEAERVAQSLKEDIIASQTMMGPYWYALGCIELGRGDLEAAIGHFRQTLNTWHDYPVHYMLAQSYLAADRVAEAVVELEGLQSDYTRWRVFWSIWNAQSYYYLGIAYEKSNWREKAIAQYETFLGLWQDVDHESEMIGDAARRLAHLRESL